MDKNLIIETIIRGISSTLQSVKIYTVEHRTAQKAIDVIYNSITEYVQQYGDLEFGIAGDELFSGKEIFFNLSKQLKELIDLLKDKNIERIIYKRSLCRLELVDFFEVLVACLDGEPFLDASQRMNKKFPNIDAGRIGGTVSSDKQKSQDIDKDKDNKKHCQKIYNSLLDENKGAIENIISGEAIDVESVYNFSCDIFNMIMYNRDSLFTMMNLKRHDDYTFVHSLNVAVLTIFQAQYLGFPEAEAIRLGMAGLFHDNGKLAIKKQLLNKKGKLTDEEFENIKSHTILGAELMLDNPDFDKMFLIAAHQHHLGVNLKKYPRPSFLKRQSLVAQIVAISDVYDALRSRRSYKEGMPLEKVYDIMQKEKDSLLNSELVDLFFKHVGVWPVGTLVKLGTGEVGLVKEVNHDDSFSPLVEILYDSSNVYLQHPFIADLSEKLNDKYLRRIEKHLAPDSDEGKRYVSELYG